MTNKEVHITHCISLESSINSHSFGDMLNDSKCIYKEKDIDNLYIEDNQHKYDQNILTFINKRKRGRYPNSLNSHSCSKFISFLQFQQETPSTRKIPLKVANSERIEFIDGKITMNQINISNKNSESDLLVEDEGNLFSREFEFDYKAKDQLKICGYYGGIEGKKFYYNEKEFNVGINENKNGNESAIEKIGKDISKISGEEGENGKSAMVYEEEEEQGKNDKEKELLDLVRRNEEEDEREINQKNGDEDINKKKENEIIKENNDINNNNENGKDEIKEDERENEEINKIQEINENVINNDNMNKQEDNIKKEDNIDNKQENDTNKVENIDEQKDDDDNANKEENFAKQKDDVNKEDNKDKQKDNVNKVENVKNQNDDAHKEDNIDKQIDDVHKEENVHERKDNDVNKNENINNIQKDVVNEEENFDKQKEDAHKDKNVNKLKDDGNKEENVNKLKDNVNQEENTSKQEDNNQNTDNLIDNNINPTEKLSEIINNPNNNNSDIKENIINNDNNNVEIIDNNKNLENNESKTIENNKSLIVPPQENLDKKNELTHIKDETHNNNNNDANLKQNEEIIKQENNKTEPKENIPPNKNDNNKEQQQNIQPTKDITNHNPQQLKSNISNDKQQTIPPNNEIINNKNQQQFKPKTSNDIKELPKIQINNTSNIQQPSLNTSNIYQPKQQTTDQHIILLEDRLKWNGDELEEQQQSINKSKRNSLNALKKHPKNKSISSNNSDSIVLSPFIPSTNKPSQITGLYNHNTVKRNSQKIKLTSKPRNEIIKQQLNDSFQSNSNNTQHHHQHQKPNNNSSISHDKESINNDSKFNYQPHQLKPLGSNDSFQNPTPTISSNMSRLAEIKKYHVFNKTKNFFFADCNQQQQIKIKPKSGFMYPNKSLKSNRTLSGGKILMSGITEKHFQRYMDYYKTLMQDKSNPYSVYWNEKFFNKHKDNHNHEQIIYHDINSYAPTVLKRRLVLNGNADTSNKRRNSVSPQYELIEKTYLGNNYKKQTNAKTNNGITHQNCIKYNSSDNTSINNDLNRNDKKKMQTIDNVKYPSIYKYFH